MQQKLSKMVICGSTSICMLFTSAFALELIPVGRTVGVKMQADGVIIASVESVSSDGGESQPAADAGLQAGDVIVSINGTDTPDNAELQKMIALSAGLPMTVDVKRDGQSITLEATATEDVNGNLKLGMYVRDGVAGIGTVTFVDPETGAFGALGHGICDTESGALLPLEVGSVMESSVASVIAGEVGAPGALQGEFNLTEDMGTLVQNTEQGIFGTLTSDDYYANLEPMTVAEAAEITVGACTILSNVAGETVEEYDAEIVQIYEENGTACAMMVSITDPDLLAVTGGIVQGMVLRYNYTNRD